MGKEWMEGQGPIKDQEVNLKKLSINEKELAMKRELATRKELFITGDADFKALVNAIWQFLAHAKYDQKKHVIRETVLHCEIVDNETGEDLKIMAEEGYEMTCFRVVVGHEKPSESQTDKTKKAKRQKRDSKPES